MVESRTLRFASCTAREKSARMKTGLLSTLIASPALALVSLSLAILMTLGSWGNLYAAGPEYGTSSVPVLLSQRDAVVERVQRALRQRGYYAHAIDGFLGQYTGEAIQLFEVDHCLRTAPLITRRLLISLGIERDTRYRGDTI
jgi:peptidoglycan hydrolase-like protein with peptidoglycan-binding domain